jgi:glycogen(starch) synthase
MTNTEKLRVLAICQEDPAWILGGMGMHCRELYRSMARRGDVQIDFLTNGPGEGCAEYLGYAKHQADKLVCYKPKTAGMSSFLFSDLQMARTLTQLLAQGRRWDVVHMHEWTAVQLGRMARDALRVPLVGTMHLCITRLAMVEDPESMRTIGQWPEIEFYLRQQEGNLISDPDATILCSKSYVRTVRETFLTRRPIEMIYNGIDPEVWRPGAGDKTRTGIRNDRPVALYVGRIATMKGIVPLLEALESGDLGWRVVIAGEVNANSEEEKESWGVTKRLRDVEATHPERLRWVGFKHGQALHDLYELADAVIMPSIHEPFGIVALEAMASGCPLLATEVDGLGEIVNKDCAQVLEPGSARSIVAGLHALRDHRLRRKLRARGLERIRAFSWQQAAAQTVDVYRRVVQDARSAETSNRS